MATVITPIFDPSDCVWYTEDGVTAKSLSQLQRKLGPEVQLEGYYPNGYSNVIRPRAPTVAKVTLPEVVAQERSLAYVSATKEGQAKDAEIAAREKPKRQYRRRDTFQEETSFERIDWKDPNNQNKLKDLVALKLTSSQIAFRLKCTRGAVIGACNRLGFQLAGKGRPRDNG